MKWLVGGVVALFSSCLGPQATVEDVAACDDGRNVTPQERVWACNRVVGTFEEGSRPYAAFLLSRAQAKEAAGDAAGALADYDAGLEILPESGFGLLGRGRLLLASGDLVSAKQTLHRAIEVNDSVIARDMLGAHAFLRGDFREAHDYYNAILERESGDPMDVIGLYGRGVARLRMDDEEGQADIERAEQMSTRIRQHFEERGIRP